MSYLGINLKKNVQALSGENCNTFLLRKSFRTLKKTSTESYATFIYNRLNTAKTSILLKVIYRVN